MGTGSSLEQVSGGLYMWAYVGRGIFESTTSTSTTSTTSVSIEISSYEDYGGSEWGLVEGYNFADLYGSSYNDSDSAMDACIDDEE